MRQELRFCTAPDGVRLAYALSGHGAPLVKAGNWMTHLERDWTSPVWRHWLTALGAEQTMVRYDERGSGLSDREYPSLAFDDWVSDLETVVDSADIDRFTLLGLSQGGPIAIAYAARHPERVGRLVLYGTFARGRRHRRTGPEAEEEARDRGQTRPIAAGDSTVTNTPNAARRTAERRTRLRPVAVRGHARCGGHGGRRHWWCVCVRGWWWPRSTAVAGTLEVPATAAVSSASPHGEGADHLLLEGVAGVALARRAEQAEGGAARDTDLALPVPSPARFSEPRCHVASSSYDTSRVAPVTWPAPTTSSVWKAVSPSVSLLIATEDQFHRPDPNVPYADSVGALRDLLDAGKIRMAGVSNADTEQIRTAQQILGVRLVSVQNQFSPAFRSSEPELQLSDQLGIAFLPWSPLGGIKNAADLANRHQAFADVADKVDATPHQVTLAWMLAKSPVVIPIPGSSRPETIRARSTPST